MITLLVGTNRPGSNTRKVAKHVEQVYRELGVPLKTLDLADLPAEIFHPSSYETKPPAFSVFSEAILNSTGLVIVTPEYNGSVPGILKYFIDMLKFPESFEKRPVCFVGVAAGIWGALRPIEQLQQIFGYRNAFIYPERVFMPRINQLLDDDGALKDEDSIGRLRAQAIGFVEFVEKLRAVKVRPSKIDLENSILERLAVCSWSLQPKNPAQLIGQMQQIGLNQLQIALDPIREQPEVWGNVQEDCSRAGIRLVSGMFGTIGEDYTTMETIRRTGGVVPDETWEQNWKNIQVNADIAARLKLGVVTFHAGFLPHEESDPSYGKLFSRISKLADLFASRNIQLGFETGQESADTLRQFLTKLNRDNVGVNFDPANMILYEKGDPIAALRTLAPWLKQCHIKDARQTKVSGTWGEEVPSGTGEVDWNAFFRVLREVNFQGYLCIEREAGQQRVADIQAARDMVLTKAAL